MRIDRERIAELARTAEWTATEDSVDGRCAFLNACLDLLDQLYNDERMIREELDRLLPEL